MNDSDYSDQLASLAEVYIESPDIKRVLLSRSSEEYLHTIYTRIVSNNELLLKGSNGPKFFVIKDKVPFYFSLPKNQYFFSTGLINKYFKNESLLISALTFEIIKSQRGLFLRNAIVPVGYLHTEKLVSLCRVPLKVRVEIDKWAYYAMKRSGYDANAILNWIQILNKNTLDFTLLIDAAQQISREEFLFKNFLVSQGIGGDDFAENNVNSSKYFYRLKQEIENKS